MPLARQTFRWLFAPSGSKRRKASGSGNENLDYFGQTVNVAARVQSLADAGDGGPPGIHA